MFGKSVTALAALLPAVVLGQSIAGNGSTVMSDGKYQVVAEGIRANFIPYGASISNLFINDTHGIERDIVLGFDNASYYSTDKLHPHLGGVPGAFEIRVDLVLMLILLQVGMPIVSRTRASRLMARRTMFCPTRTTTTTLCTVVHRAGTGAVSYTHLTLPTKRIV